MKAGYLAAILAVFSFAHRYGWGQEGHSTIAEIAQHQLDDTAFGKIENLLGGKISLASIASWADDYRATHPDTAGWHFVNIPYDRSTYDPSVDCKNDNCSV